MRNVFALRPHILLAHVAKLDPVCPTQDVFLLPDYLAIVMDYCNRGDLAEFMAGYIAERVRLSSTHLVALLP